MLPILYRKGKNNELLQWRCWAEQDFIYTEHGQVGGKLQQSKKRVQGKNLGKANETTAEQQAQKEVQSLWTAKRTRKYVETIEDAEKELFLPMLATTLVKGKTTFPGYTQPKLDGVRALVKFQDQAPTIYSRAGRVYSESPHVNQNLTALYAHLDQPNLVLDGELYAHGLSFQQVTRLVKKNRPESTQIKLHIYDVPQSSVSDKGAFSERLKALALIKQVIATLKLQFLEVVTTLPCPDKTTLQKHEAKFLEQGYEGLIYRLPDAIYQYAHRSQGLLKVKQFQDAEYLIVGYKEGEGRLEKTVIWICECNSGEFDVTPTGPLEQRAELFTQADQLVGQLLKVKFFGFTDAGLPRFPVGLGIRSLDDL